jgi:hypothetical protein
VAAGQGKGGLICEAQYDPKPHWKFETRWLKNRRGIGIMAKFRWIEQITGQELGDADKETDHFKFLKNIRNHFNHFYPPCVVFAVEDVCEWLNRVPAVGRLLWKVRERMDEPASKGIVEIITLLLVEFVPRDPRAPRVKQGDDVGYTSSCWPGP